MIASPVNVRARFSKPWLSLTPEPERELPTAIAVLRAGGPPAEEAVRREIERADEVVMRGSERSYLAWLADAADLASAAPVRDPDVAAAAAVVRDVVTNQAGLLLGLPDRRPRREQASAALARAAGHEEEAR
jgi:hypothetical protein